MPFIQNREFMLSYEAGEDLSDKQFYFVKMDANGRVVLCDTLGERVLGVLQNKPKANETAQVVLSPGGSPVKAAGAIALNALVVTAADGRATTKSAANEWIAGVSDNATTAADETVTVGLQFAQATN